MRLGPGRIRQAALLLAALWNRAVLKCRKRKDGRWKRQQSGVSNQWSEVNNQCSVLAAPTSALFFVCFVYFVVKTSGSRETTKRDGKPRNTPNTRKGAIALMRFLLLNQTFYPDVMASGQHLTHVALALAERGHRVTVVTSRRAYDHPETRFPKQEIWRGVRIHRVGSTGFGKGAKWRRAVDFASFSALCSLRLAVL